MPTIYSDAKNGTLEIISYGGASGKRKICKLESSLESPLSSQRWNFFRQENNHAYVNGKVFYENDCRNNVIISPYINNRLVTVRNAFVFVGDSSIEVSPISGISNAIGKEKRKLSNQEINYHIPKAVFERENLIEKNIGELKEKIKQKYEIKPKEISMVKSRRTKNGIYYVRAEDGREYFLKFKTHDKKRILYFYDWFGNRLMRNRDNSHLFYNYKTMEEWKKIFERYGMKQIKSEFIKENKLHPDIFPPKAILVFQKNKRTNN